MFGNQKFSREQDEYERQQAINVTGGLVHFFAKYLGYWVMWLCTSALTASILDMVFYVNKTSSLAIGVFVGFLIFKLSYVKEHPIKSVIMVWFIAGLFFVAFLQNS